MLKDICIISVEVEYEVIYTLLNGVIAGDLRWPLTNQTTQICTFCIAFHIFIVGECGTKFAVQVDHSKSQPMDD